MDNNTILTPKIDTNIINDNNNQLMEDDLFIKLSKHKSVHIVLKSFNKKNDKQIMTTTPYILGIDKDVEGGKFYIGFIHITDLICFIESWKYGNLYEMITNDIVKPYFDIDYKVGKYKTDKEVNTILTDFLTEFNKYYLHKATIENTYCYGKRDKNTKLWKSIHIVIDGFMISKESLKDFCLTINYSNDDFKKLLGKMDSKVYTYNRAFSFLHQNKMGGKEFFEWIYCWEDDDKKYSQTDITYKYLINNVSAKKCKLNHHYDTSPIYFDETNNKIIKKETKSLKRMTAIETKDLVIINNKNIVDELLKHLPNDFYNDALWFKITIQIILHGYNGVDKWLRECAIKSNNYTYEKNKKFAENVSDVYYSNNIQLKLDELNNTYGLCFIWDLLDTFTEQLKIWICEKTNTDMINLNKAIMNYKTINQSKKHSTDERLIIGNNFMFHIRKQLLTNDIDKKIFHYGLDTGFDNQYGLDTTKFKTITQDEIKNYMEEFLKSINRLSGWKMLWGSGKTHFGVDTINKYAIDNEIRILFLTENNNLNTEMTTKFNGLSHLDKDNLINIDDATMVVSSLESLNMILNKNTNNFEIIVFDEFESIIQHLLSTETFKSTKTTPFEVSCLIKNIINDANKIVCLDCDLSEERMDLITNIFKENNDDEIPQLFNCSHNSWIEYDYEIYISVLNMRFDMKNDLFNDDKRIIYATGSKIDALTQYETFITECESEDVNKNMLVITADGVEYIIDGEKYDKKEFQRWNLRLKKELKRDKKDTELITKLNKQILIGRYTQKNKFGYLIFENLESVLIELKIECFIYSPSIKCGISFGNDKNNLLFDKCYGYATNGSVVAREFLQMLHRCRHLRDKKICFNIKNGFTQSSQLFKYDIIDSLIDKNQQLKFNSKWNDKNYDGDKYTIDDFYKSITITNFKEMMDSQRNITQEILGKLKFNHNMKIVIKNFHENHEITSKTEYDDTKEHLMDIRKLLFRYEPKLSQSEYEKAVADKMTNDSYEARRKYIQLKRLHLNKSNSKYLKQDRLFEKEKYETLDTPRTSGIYENYITNKNGKCFYCFGSSYKDDIKYNENGEYLSFGKHSKWSEMTYEMKNKYYYGDCDEMSEEISYQDYDLDIYIQHTKKLGNLTFNTNDSKCDYLSRFIKANNEIITGYTYETERDENDFTLSDINTNKLKIVKQAMDILGLKRVDLIYKRKIITNKQLKKILDDNANWVNNDLLTFIDDMDTKTIGKTKINITDYKSSNKTYYKYVKNLIINHLSQNALIETKHRNRSGGIEKNKYDDDNVMIVFQYECDGNNTFINTEYEPLQNEIYKYQNNGDELLLKETITKQVLNENKTIKKRYNQIDNKYHTYRNNFYKKNRYAIIKNGDVERSVKIPFNLFSCDNCYDGSNNIIDLKDKSDDERVAIYLKIELKNPSIEPSYKMTDINTTKHDIKLYEFNDVSWKQTEDYYVKEQIVKYTTDKDKEDINIITKNQTTEDVVKDILYDIIGTIEAKDKFKNMINDNINVVGEQDSIKQSLKSKRDALGDGFEELNKEIHFNIHKPNIYIDWEKEEQLKAIKIC